MSPRCALEEGPPGPELALLAALSTSIIITKGPDQTTFPGLEGTNRCGDDRVVES